MTGLEACLERRCVSERAHLTSGWPLEVNQKGIAGNAGCDRLATPAVGICDTSKSSAPSMACSCALIKQGTWSIVKVCLPTGLGWTGDATAASTRIPHRPLVHELRSWTVRT